ncbi:anti-sigma factor family protein [Angustibacter sp. McL0619]|uniref:anti-sigma factor family protein n=1 Tax=Angustibacter sp. McL0619 TaxID=3415676 RepID=UPI003CF24369
MNDTYETWAGPYVLGALSPAERDEFARHLTECSACRTAVEELAGLPGLLSRVPASVLDELADGVEPVPVPPLPDTLLPSLLRSARRRRRGLAVALAAGAAAAVALVLGLTVLGGDDGSAGRPPTRPTVVAGAPMRVIGQAPISANVAVTSVGWGTKLDLTCQYVGYERGEAPYALVVVDRAGGTEQVGTWNAVPGKQIRMSAGTALRRADIRSVQVRTLTGRTVLDLDLT